MGSKKPSMHCGASSHHIYCNNYEFKSEEKLLPFGRDEFDIRSTWIDVNNCSGIVTPQLFTMFSNVEYLNFNSCSLEFSPKAFSLLKKLKAIYIRESTVPIIKDIFEESDNLEHLHLNGLKLSDINCFAYLNNLKMLNIKNCTFEDRNGELFKNLKKLKYLLISNCQIAALGNIYKNMENLESITILSNKFGEFDCTGIAALKKLTHIGIFNNETTAIINFDIFLKMPSLETILFNTDAYKTLDFRSLPNLKTVEIGTLTDITSNDENEIMENLKSMNIDFQYTFCGKIEVDMSKVMICA